MSFFTVALVNVCGQGHSEFKDVEFLFYFVHYHYVRLQPGHTQFRGDGAPTWCFLTWQITVHLKFTLVHIRHNEIYQVVVAPSVPVVEKQATVFAI